MTPDEINSMHETADYENLMYQLTDEMVDFDPELELPAKDRTKARIRRFNKEKEKERSQQVAGYLISKYWDLGENCFKEDKDRLELRMNRAKKIALNHLS